MNVPLLHKYANLPSTAKILLVATCVLHAMSCAREGVWGQAQTNVKSVKATQALEAVCGYVPWAPMLMRLVVSAWRVMSNAWGSARAQGDRRVRRVYMFRLQLQVWIIVPFVWLNVPLGILLLIRSWVMCVLHVPLLAQARMYSTTAPSTRTRCLLCVHRAIAATAPQVHRSVKRGLFSQKPTARCVCLLALGTLLRVDFYSSDAGSDLFPGWVLQSVIHVQRDAAPTTCRVSVRM